MNIKDINFAIEMLSHPQRGDESDINMALGYALQSLKTQRREIIKTKTGQTIEAVVDRILDPKIGNWVKHNTPNNTHYYDCSLCGCVAPCTETADSYLWKLSNFCPDCGAKMVNCQQVLYMKGE